MGCSKNHIMYWGVFTVIIIAWILPKVCTNITIINICFCAFSHHSSLYLAKFPLRFAQNNTNHQQYVAFTCFMTETVLQIHLL